MDHLHFFPLLGVKISTILSLGEKGLYQNARLLMFYTCHLVLRCNCLHSLGFHFSSVKQQGWATYTNVHPPLSSNVLCGVFADFRCGWARKFFCHFVFKPKPCLSDINLFLQCHFRPNVGMMGGVSFSCQIEMCECGRKSLVH